MVNLLKKIAILFAFLGLPVLAFLPNKILAQAVINEVSPASVPEWVEIFNSGLDGINLKDYSLNFGTDTQTLYFCSTDQIAPSGYKLINLDSNWMANTGDVVTLKNGDDPVDVVGYGTGYSLAKPGAGSSITRFPDGSSNWILTSDISPQGEVVSFECPTPAPTPTPGQTETPNYKATYKINASVDGGGQALDSVQIYVDGEYTHHEDNEILYFFNGHECYAGVSCDLGTHTISLRKSGYSSWEDTKNFTAGFELEVNPVLPVLRTTTSVPTNSPTPSLKPTIYKTSTPSAQIGSSTSALLSTPAILGLSGSPVGVENTDDQKSGKIKKFILPSLITITGIGFIGFSIFSIIRNAKKEDIKVP